jgi:hypothetical protein
MVPTFVLEKSQRQLMLPKKLVFHKLLILLSTYLITDSAQIRDISFRKHKPNKENRKDILPRK